MREKSALHGYQQTAVRFLHDNPFSALFVDMGLGKSAISLTLLDELAGRFAFDRALIIAPLRVANQVWPAEIAAWRHTHWMTHSLLTGSAAQREQAALSPALIHIINREQVEWLVQFWARRRRWPYDVVIIDESSSVKDHTTKRFKALKKVRQHVRRMHQLTATPASESHMGLFAQIYLLDGGQRFGTHITPFREEYFTYNQYSMQYAIRPGAAERIADKISDICLVMKAEDHLSREKPIFVDRKVRLTAAQMKAYRAFEREFILDLPDGQEIEANTAAELSGKLLQLASGAVYDHERVAQHVHDHKIDELRQLQEGARGRPLLVAYGFQSSRERLRKAFPKAVVMDRKGDAVGPWNKGKIDMLLVHPASAGHGLNLQAGGHILVFFDLPWSLELYLQTIGRLDRQGQEKVVRVYHIVAEGTVDELVLSRLKEKQDAQEALFQRIRRMRRQLSGKGTGDGQTSEAPSGTSRGDQATLG